MYFMDSPIECIDSDAKLVGFSGKKSNTISVLDASKVGSDVVVEVSKLGSLISGFSGKKSNIISVLDSSKAGSDVVVDVSTFGSFISGKIS